MTDGTPKQANIFQFGSVERAAGTTWTTGVVLGLLLCADAALVAVDAALPALIGRRPNLFDLNGEANIPTWWSSAQLLVSGLLIALVALRNRRNLRQTWSLSALAALVILMSLDETACFHERLGGVLDSFLDRAHSVLPRTGYWPLLVGLPAAATVVWALRGSVAFLRPVRHSAARFLLALAVLFGGALGVELFNNVGSAPLLRAMIELEEGLEMVGGSLLVWSALDLVSRHPTTAEGWSRLCSSEVQGAAPRAMAGRSTKAVTRARNA